MIVLASTSYTRQAVLKAAGLSFDAVSPQVNETALVAANPHWSPAETALKLAGAKALAVSATAPSAVVIGADQVLALENRVYAKPRDSAECRMHLRELRGRTHRLISSAVCAREGRVEWSCTAEACLTMRDFSDAFLESYLVAVGQDCTTSVGGYKIEGPGIQLFENVVGDHFTILGLPLLPLLDYLRSCGEIAS
jgi:septum formation protein